MTIIETKLLYDDPQKSRILTLSTSPIQLFIIYRYDEQLLDQLSELQQHAFYILFGHETGNYRRKFYPGQTQNAVNRTKQHLKGKEFWELICIFVNTKEEFCRSEVQYLEYLGIKSALECNTYDLLDNCQIPVEPVLNSLLKDNIIKYFNDIKLLLLHQGFYLYYYKVHNFQDITKENSHNIISRVIKNYKKDTSKKYIDENDYYYDEPESQVYTLYGGILYEAKGMILSNCKIYIFKEGFICVPIDGDNNREELINKAIENKQIENKTYKIISDIIFDTPNDAEYFITGKIENAWVPKIDMDDYA